MLNGAVQIDSITGRQRIPDRAVWDAYAVDARTPDLDGSGRVTQGHAGGIRHRLCIPPRGAVHRAMTGPTQCTLLP
jgi:hypothetical protein